MTSELNLIPFNKSDKGVACSQQIRAAVTAWRAAVPAAWPPHPPTQPKGLPLAHHQPSLPPSQLPPHTCSLT